ncbi:glutathione S-transferase [Fusarium albosuccineum]|uniref:Glutathione S-transferase n=1 Tax=Fusarium albosuccineum TaxID=1237068 RepID=A0A8H4LKT5_9HYPO|nr:glutathione S-transferase [Fusarium albosuccineum]
MASKETPQLTVFRGFGKLGAFTWSPFVIKLEARLRFDGTPYKVDGGSPKSAPRGKIPYVELGEQRVSDSTFIIQKFVQDGIITDLNSRLSPAQRAQDLAIRALLEDKLYFYGTREKWCDNYQTMRSNALASIPWPLQVVVGWIAYQGISKTLYGQGTGRFTDDEVAMLREEVWESVDALVSEARASASLEGPFWLLGGDGPTEVDATLFGFIASALTCEASPASGKVVGKYPAVVDYAARIHERYFPDYEGWE